MAMESTASSEPPSPERDLSLSPPSPPPVNEEPVEDEAADIVRRTCPVCARVFDTAKAMWGHSWVHRERKEQIHSMAPPVEEGESAAAVGGAWHPWKIDSMDERDRTCPRCGKMFASPKAMFGHLHVHYARSPARREEGESSSSQLGPVVEERLVVEVSEGGDGDGDGNSPVSIDLNRPVCMEDEKANSEDSSSSSSSSSPIDLNKVLSC